MQRSEIPNARTDLSTWFTDAIQRLEALERYVTAQLQEVDQRETTAAERDRVLGERETVIAAGERELARQRLAANERTEQLDKRDAALRELDQTLQLEREQNEHMQATLSEQSRRLSELAQQLEQQERDWESRQAYLHECEQAINRFQQAFETMFAQNLNEVLGTLSGGRPAPIGAAAAQFEDEVTPAPSTTATTSATATRKAGRGKTIAQPLTESPIGQKALAALAARTRSEVERILTSPPGDTSTATESEDDITLLETPPAA